MTAETLESPVTEAVRSLEVRWIFPGQLETAVAGWFGRFSARRSHARTATCWIRSCPGLSVKVRGGGALEVKMHRGSPGILEVAGRARGRMESWQKWSFPFSPLRQDSGAAGGGDLERALRSRLAGPVPLNPRDHQSWPRVRTSVSSTSHHSSPPSPRSTIRHRRGWRPISDRVRSGSSSHRHRRARTRGSAPAERRINRTQALRSVPATRLAAGHARLDSAPGSALSRPARSCALP